MTVTFAGCCWGCGWAFLLEKKDILDLEPKRDGMVEAIDVLGGQLD